MKVLFIHNEYEQRGGEEQAILNIRRLLENRGHTSTTFFRSSAGLSTSMPGKVTALFAGIYNPRSAQEMERVLSSDKPDVAHVQNLYPFISSSVLPVLKRHGVPVVMRCPNYRLTCPTGLHLQAGAVCEACLGPWKEVNCIRHNCEGNWPKSLGYSARHFINRITATVLDNVDAYMVLSEFQKAKFIEAGIPGERLHVVHNPAMLPLDTPLPAPSTGPVGFVGRFSAEKGILDFVELARSMPSVDFAVAGCSRAQLEPHVGIPNNLDARGFLVGAELERFYREARAIVVPSRWFEGFPNVIATAMAHGRPVLAYRIGAIPEIVEDERTGVLCDVGNADGLRDGLRRILENAELAMRLGLNGYRKASTTYSEDKVSAQVLSVYSTAIGNAVRCA